MESFSHALDIVLDVVLVFHDFLGWVSVVVTTSEVIVVDLSEDDTGDCEVCNRNLLSRNEVTLVVMEGLVDPLSEVGDCLEVFFVSLIILLFWAPNKDGVELINKVHCSVYA